MYREFPGTKPIRLLIWPKFKNRNFGTISGLAPRYSWLLVDMRSVVANANRVQIPQTKSSGKPLILELPRAVRPLETC